MTTFNQVKEANLKRLEQFVPIVARVHGDSHPEFHDVHGIFGEIKTKIKEAGSAQLVLDKEFAALRKVTDNYTVPGDVCESYEAVYEMLAELDKAYHA